MSRKPWFQADGVVTIEQVVARERFCLTGAVMPVGRDSAHYEEGRNYAGFMEYVTISVNNVWGGYTKDGGSLQSYEKIGYHRGSADFLAGMVDAGCPVYVAWIDDNDCIVWKVVTA